MTETRTLLIYGEPEISKLKEAKASMGLDFLVVPKFLTDNYNSGWGLYARVLAYDATPPFACDHALIGPKTSQEGLVAALRWVLFGGDDPRVTRAFDMLSKWMGMEIKELAPDEMTEYDKQQNLKKASVRFKLGEPGDSRDR